MADNTAIEWTDATWNPITGCSVISPGCTNCYAMKLAGTRLRHTPSRQGLTIDSNAGPVWNGQVRFNEQMLAQPLHWKKPRKIFVCAHGDLFHENVPDEWIDKVFAVMALAPQHQFQVLTKRTERMRDYMRSRQELPPYILDFYRDAAGQAPDRGFAMLPNVWLGVSVEDQPRADERIPHLLATPAAIRFISAEPLLGPIDLTNLKPAGSGIAADAHGISAIWTGNAIGRPSLDWVIAGGESGARPMHPDWARSLRDQCAAAGVPFFFKQNGSWVPHWPVAGGDLGGDVRAGRVASVHPGGQSDIEVFEQTGGRNTVPGTIYMRRVGKKAAGNLLDGRQHLDFPK